MTPLHPEWHAAAAFPDHALADENGLLCVSRGLDAGLLWAGYQHGVFPWTDNPVGWFAPAKRGVLLPNSAHFPRNLPKLWRKANFAVRFDTAFADVMAACRAHHAQDGEWITPRFIAAYTDLFHYGHAHSIEIWQNERLVGGTYGVQTGSIFSAESMFGAVPNASRCAVYALVQASSHLELDIIDVQVVGEVTAGMGAISWERNQFNEALQTRLGAPGARAPKRWPPLAWSPSW